MLEIVYPYKVWRRIAVYIFGQGEGDMNCTIQWVFPEHDVCQPNPFWIHWTKKEIQCLTSALDCGQLAVVLCHPRETNSHEVRGIVWPLPSPTLLTSFGHMPSCLWMTSQVQHNNNNCKQGISQHRGHLLFSYTSEAKCPDGALGQDWLGLWTAVEEK